MKHHRILFIGISILVLALLTFPSTAQDDENEIVFVRGWYSYNIAIVSSKGVVPVTNEKDKYSHLNTPEWSPDGTRIAFTDGKNIYIVNADGSHLLQFTNYNPLVGQSISNISWSPDGLTMAATLYSSDNGYSGYWIRLINIESLDEQDITSHDFSDGKFGISWSPDGQSIVFTSNRNSEIPDASGLYVVNVKSGKVSALTDVVSRRRDDHYPSWSPDGKQIAFVSVNDEDGGWEIFLLDVSKSTFQRLTDQRHTPKIGTFPFGGTIDWSPNGEQIVFSRCPVSYPVGCYLFTIRVDGTDLVQLTDDKENGDFDPSWKPTVVHK